MPHPTDRTVLEGQISVEAALRARSREIDALLIDDRLRDRRDRRFAALLRLAADARVPVRRVSIDEIKRHASGRTHGGIVALSGPRLHIALDALLAGHERPWIAMLDGLEDPYNYGQAVRALYAAGAHGLVVRERDWEGAAGVVARASAGASELFPTAAVGSALDAAEALGRAGLTVACAARGEGAASPDDAELSGPLFLVLGGERRGVSRPLLERADLLLELPYGRRFPHSLGLATATAALAWEVLRQRRARLE